MTTASLMHVSFVCTMAFVQFALPPAEARSAEPARSVGIDLFSLRVACAESDLAVVQAEERLADWRNRGRTRLYREGHVSWREQAESTAAYAIAVAKRISTQRYCNWLKAYANAHTRADNAMGTSEAQAASDQIDLMIPGSHAVIGWVRPMELPSEMRAELLDLMRQRAESCRVDPQAVDHAIRAVDATKAALQALKSATASVVEIEHAEWRMDLANAELQRVRAERDLREFEYQRLAGFEGAVSEFTEADLETASDLAIFPIALHRQAREILDCELRQQGVGQVAQVSTEWSRFTQRVAVYLHRLPLSIANTSVPGSEQYPSQVESRHMWLSRWLRLLDSAASFETRTGPVVQAEHHLPEWDESTSDPADVPDILPVEAIPEDLVRDSRRRKRLMDLVQEWYRASARVSAARCESKFKAELFARAANSTKQNPREMAKWNYQAELSQAELKATEDERAIVALQIRHVLQLSADGSEPAWNLRLIDEESSRILVQLAEHRAATTPYPANEDVTRAKSRRDLLIAQQSIGRASPAEVQAAEVIVRQSEVRLRAGQQQHRLAQIDARLMVTVLELRTAADKMEKKRK